LELPLEWYAVVMTQRVRSENRGNAFYPLEPFVPEPRRFTVDDLSKLLDSGILTEGERIELIDGELIPMAAMHNPHIYAITKLTRELFRVFPETAGVNVQLPLTVLDKTQHIPDFYVMRPDYNPQNFPTAAACSLVVEILDSTLRFDHKIKLPKYALSGIPEYWIIDLNSRRLEVYRDPSGDDYLEKTTLQTGQTVRPLEFPEIEVRWDVALMDPENTNDSTSG